MAILARVYSKQGTPIRLTHERWSHIVESHDYMAGNLDLVIETIAEPDYVTLGIKDEVVAVKEYIKTTLGRKHVAVVYRDDSEDGFVITAFMTSRVDKIMKRGIQWQKS